jgi:hypothetical protein
MGLPRPRRTQRHLFRLGSVAVAEVGDVRSPCLIDYPYGLVLDRGYVRIWIGPEGLTPATRSTLADQLEAEAARLREEAGATSAYLRRLGRESDGDPEGGDDDESEEGEPGPVAAATAAIDG